MAKKKCLLLLGAIVLIVTIGGGFSVINYFQESNRAFHEFHIKQMRDIQPKPHKGVVQGKEEGVDDTGGMAIFQAGEHLLSVDEFSLETIRTKDGMDMTGRLSNNSDLSFEWVDIEFRLSSGCGIQPAVTADIIGDIGPHEQKSFWVRLCEGDCRGCSWGAAYHLTWKQQTSSSPREFIVP